MVKSRAHQWHEIAINLQGDAAVLFAQRQSALALQRKAIFTHSQPFSFGRPIVMLQDTQQIKCITSGLSSVTKACLIIC